MPSDDSPPSDPADQRSKKRSRNAGACDLCKKRKIRCDGGQMPGNRCSNCIGCGVECTHAEVMKTLGSAKGYVESLETRLEKMEKLLTKLLPGIDFTEQLETAEEDPATVEAASCIPRNDADHLLTAIKKLTLDPEQHRFFGKSSGIQFVQTALNFKSHYTGPQNIAHPSLPKRREEYWEPTKWLLPGPEDMEHPEYNFPEPDLLSSLVQLYFENVNCLYPVLHRPTFERKLKEDLHLRDHRYASTLLLVCALGARHSNDKRVCLDDTDSFHAAGWKWHNQVRVIPKHLVYKPNLYELQTIALSSIFLMPISPVAWNQIGFGLRRAQDVGAHRRMKQRPTAESEQWKRVFWVLLCLEWSAGTATGRPLAMHEEDFDQDYPIDCDDEYWELPEPFSFKQPKDKPSFMSYFIHHAKLLEIQASVTTAIYSPRRPKDIAGRPIPPISDAQTIVSFDSALNSWLMDTPEHLRWDPNRKDPLHFLQSSLLHAEFYNVQIMVHRPYIPGPAEVSRPGSLPSLTICTNAARACARIIQAQDKRDLEPDQQMLSAAFTSAIVILVNTWSTKRNGFGSNPDKEMEDVWRCMKLLSMAEKRHQSAGRFNDILLRLISVGEIGQGQDPLTRPYIERTAPPLAQPGYEPSAFVGEPQPPVVSQLQAPPATVHVASKEPPVLDQQFLAELNSATTYAPATTFIGNTSVLGPVSQDDLLAYTPKDPPYSGLIDFEQLMRMAPQQYPSDMVVDADIMSMWSAAPSGFQLSDWESYVMSSGVPPIQPILDFGFGTASPPAGSGIPNRVRKHAEL